MGDGGGGEDPRGGNQDSCSACFHRCRLMGDRDKKPKVTAPTRPFTSDKRIFKQVPVPNGKMKTEEYICF